MKPTLTTQTGAAARGAFGTMQFGGRADPDDSRAMFDSCRAAGITHFDTAHVYTDGNAETLLGQMIRDQRDNLLIATKAGYSGGAGAANIEAQFDISRSRLGLDMVDLLYLHRFDPNTELAQTLDCFARLKQAGKIRYVGLSNFAAWQVMKAVRVAAQFDLTIDALQPMYNLVKRQAEVEILPMCADQGIAVFAYSPLGGGLLTGKYAHGGAGRLAEDARYASRYGADWMADTATRFADLATGIGADPATLAVAWVAASPYAPTPIISARNRQQLTPSLAAQDFVMPPDLYARITALSVTPPPATDRLEEAS